MNAQNTKDSLGRCTHVCIVSCVRTLCICVYLNGCPLTRCTQVRTQIGLYVPVCLIIYVSAYTHACIVMYKTTHEDVVSTHAHLCVCVKRVCKNVYVPDVHRVLADPVYTYLYVQVCTFLLLCVQGCTHVHVCGGAHV